MFKVVFLFFAYHELSEQFCTIASYRYVSVSWGQKARSMEIMPSEIYFVQVQVALCSHSACAVLSFTQTAYSFVLQKYNAAHYKMYDTTYCISCHLLGLHVEAYLAHVTLH